MAFSTTDTIVAIATPPGRGGIGVVRISGSDATRIASGLVMRSRPLRPRHATFTRIRLKTVPSPAPESGSSVAHYTDVDQVVATFFPGPHSYTGEDIVELSAHGSPVVLRTIVAAAMNSGARLAEPGEFTLRAFLNGRIDLPQAEAVADLIDAATPLQAHAAFDQLQGTLTNAIAAIDATLFDLIARLEASIDFPDEGFHFIEPRTLAQELDKLCDRTKQLLRDGRRGRLLREGLGVAIVGRPNVGKSSVFNALAGAARAIVSDVPGTTRDLITESLDLDGMRVTLIDTAGLRRTADLVEAEGVARSRSAQAVADLTLVVVDGSQALEEDDLDAISQTSDNKRLIVKNKSDLVPAWSVRRQQSSDDGDQTILVSEPELDEAVEVSAITGAGFEELRARMAAALDTDLRHDCPAITNVRHIALVTRALDAMTRARTAAGDIAPLSEEFVLADLQDARAALEEITGKRTSDDLLAHVFARFCVGK